MVRVGFDLFPNGSVEHIQIIKSSHNEILDKAIINAILSLEPLKQAEKFLSKKETFKVNIEFDATVGEGVRH